MHTKRLCKFKDTISTTTSGYFFTNETLPTVAEIGINVNFVKSYREFIEFNLFFIK